jgi:hypothetical protein
MATETRASILAAIQGLANDFPGASEMDRASIAWFYAGRLRMCLCVQVAVALLCPELAVIAASEHVMSMKDACEILQQSCIVLFGQAHITIRHCSALDAASTMFTALLVLAKVQDQFLNDPKMVCSAGPQHRVGAALNVVLSSSESIRSDLALRLLQFFRELMAITSEDDIRRRSEVAMEATANRLQAATRFIFAQNSAAFAYRSRSLKNAAMYWRLCFCSSDDTRARVAKVSFGEFEAM